MEDLNEAGGVYAVMNELRELGLLHEDCITVTGNTIGENIKDCENKNPQVIRPLDNPYSKTDVYKRQAQQLLITSLKYHICLKNQEGKKKTFYKNLILKEINE